MTRTLEPTALVEGREMIISRVLEAPRDLVWKAFTDPAHLTHWWGPLGFSLETEAFEFRSGGTWRHVMRGPDGTGYPNRIRFHEVVPPERLVYAHDTGKDDDPEGFHTTITLLDLGGSTHVVMRAVFQSEEACRLVVQKYGALEGGVQMLTRLVDQVVLLAGPTFRMERLLGAPVDRVWQAWTDPDQLARWWGPAGMATRIVHHDLRPGGHFLYAITPPGGAEFWGRMDYRDVAPTHHLGFAVAFSDAEGGLSRHPMAPVWPLRMLNRVTLEPVGEGTRLTLLSAALEATVEEAAAFKAGIPSMNQGWGGTLDALAAHLTPHP
ncbi:MAG TPA: SRPBCC family protein [Holophagaceae bacterium]|nr:SRPBCC family protein [Holophagaceae bacterium]